VTPKVFTVEEVNAVVPRLSELVRDLLDRARAIESRLEELRERTHGAAARPGGRGVSLEPSGEDDLDSKAEKLSILADIEVYERGWRDVQALGAVVKDTRTGLCDFYGQIDGKLVCLCWRYGEQAIEHYHALDAGFSGRKPLDAKLRQRMLN
jgi:hypothetical protein